MGWGAVWQAAGTAFGAEAVEVRLLIIVAAAFFLLMALIGLRHAFRPAEPRQAPLPEMPKPAFAAPPLPPVSQPLPQPLRVQMPALRAKRKSAKRTICRHRAVRPQIHRVARSAEIEAPYSPLPPRR